MPVHYTFLKGIQLLLLAFCQHNTVYRLATIVVKGCFYSYIKYLCDVIIDWLTDSLQKIQWNKQQHQSSFSQLHLHLIIDWRCFIIGQQWHMQYKYCKLKSCQTASKHVHFEAETGKVIKSIRLDQMSVASWWIIS